MNWPGAWTAVAMGILLGVVRERRPHANESKAGLRTHVLVSILGYVAWGLGVWPFVAVLSTLGALVYSGYRASAPQDPGLTGEMAVLVTLMLSALVHTQLAMAVGFAVLVATLLEFKQISHRFTREWITQQELQDGLSMAVAALVIMPLLPDTAVDPWNVLNPTTLWRIVVLVMAVGMIGHLAQRMLGVRWGLPLAGFCSGFVSSTAALVHWGHQARKDANVAARASAAALLSSLASLLLMTGIVGTVSPNLLRAVAWPMAAACTGLLATTWFCMRQGVNTAATAMAPTDSAFKLSHALILALVMASVSFLSVASQSVFGDAGVWVTSVVVAMAEVHAAAASVAQMSLAIDASMADFAWRWMAVLAASAMAKTVLAFVSGGSRFGFRVGWGLGLMVLGAGLVMLVRQNSIFDFLMIPPILS